MDKYINMSNQIFKKKGILKLVFLFFLTFSIVDDMNATPDTVYTVGNTGFTPSVLTVNVGDTVVFWNTSGFHNVNFASNPVLGSSGSPVGPGLIADFVFNVNPGTYNYQCDPHVGMGMIGQVIVNSPPLLAGQCINVGHTEICYGDSVELCVNINNNAASTFLYSQDFEANIGGEWTNSSGLVNIFNFNSTNILGNYANDTILLNLSTSALHDSILLEFDLYIHDSWDGTTQGETFSVLVDGNVVFSESFQNVAATQTNICNTCSGNILNNIANIPGNLCSTLNGGCTGPWLAGTGVFRFSKMIAHTSASMNINFIGLDLENGATGFPADTLPVSHDESWSLDNIIVQAFDNNSLPTVTWNDITNNNFISSDTCIHVAPSISTSYQVIIDSLGVSLCTDTVIITVNPEINISAIVNPTAGQTLCTGQIFSSANGGTGILNYQWDTSGVFYANSQNIVNLCENTYCLTVLDQEGCSADTCINIEWNPCNLSDSITTPIPCNGGEAWVQIEVDTFAGTGPIPFNPLLGRFLVNFYTANPLTLISSVNNNATITLQNLFAGEYIVSVYDRSWQDSCYINLTINEPDPIIIHTTTSPVILPANNNGIINIDSISGGTPPFVNIDWFDQSIIPPFLFASGVTFIDTLHYANNYTGGYQISVEDTNGCTADTIIYLDPVNPDGTIAIANTDSISPTCFGYCDGAYFLEMYDVGNSSVPPFEYYWLQYPTLDTIRVDSLGSPNYDPITHNASIQDLCSGAYSLHIYDYYGNGPLINEWQLFDPLPVQVDLELDFVIDCGQDTVIGSDPTGGNIANDTILISQNTLTFGSSSSAFTDTLTAGKQYLLLVTGTYLDNSGNTYDAAFDVNTQTPVMDWLLGSTNTHRPSPDVFQATNEYNFLFSGFNGVQQVVFPGSNNFSGSLTFSLFEISLDTTIYSWQWTTNPPSFPAVISTADTAYAYPGVNGTDYILNVTDQFGCPGTDTVNISWNLNILHIDTIGITNVACNGAQTGSVAIVVDTNTGFPPYSYFIDGNPTTDTTTNLSAGTYLVSISDDVGCLSDTSVVQIIENDSLYACMDLTNFVRVQVDQFILDFDTASTDTSVLTQLGLDYELVVSGVYNDTLWVPYQDAAYHWNSVTPNIGIPHTNNPWSWNGTTNARPNPDLYDPINHTYTYTFVGDGNQQAFSYIDSFGDYFGSTGQLSFTMYKLVCPNSDTVYSCKDSATAYATIYADGGVPFTDGSGNPYYKYEWKDFLGNIVDTNATATGLSGGNYTVTVIDSINCTYERQLFVDEPNNSLSIDTTSNFIDVLCFGDSSGSLTVYNTGGYEPYLCVLLIDNFGTYDTIQTFTGSLQDVDTLVFNNLPVGTYRYYLYDTMPDTSYGDYMPCPKHLDFSLTQPLELLTSTTMLDHVSCWGDSTGKANITAIGGVTPYEYLWLSTGETTTFTNSLFADTLLSYPSETWHYVVVTDSNGCEKTDSVEIMHMYEKIKPFYINSSGVGVYEINLIEDSVSCYGDCDGIAALSTVGGVLPHTYTWDVGAVNQPNHTSSIQPDTIDYLCAGGHDIIVRDDLGCQTIVRYRIEEPTQIYAIGTLTTPINCFEYDDGSAHVYGVGGNDIPPSIYSYTWTLDPNIYTAIDDSLFWIADTNTNGQSLNNQHASQTGTMLPPGIHLVTVTDYKGCTNTDTVEFIEPIELMVEFVDTVYAYCDNTESASLCVQAYGGTTNYFYQFNDAYSQTNSGAGSGDNDPFCAINLTPYNNHTTANVPAGYYYVSVLDDRGCFADKYIDIDSVTNTFNTNSVDCTYTDISCFDGTNGTIDILNLTGGVGTFPMGYWFEFTGPNNYVNNMYNPTTPPSLSSLEAGIYSVVISDSSRPIPCPITINFDLQEPLELLVTAYGNIGATCYPEANTTLNPNPVGSCDGQILVSISGGTRPYFYDLDETGVYPLVNTAPVNPNGDSLIQNLCAGDHTVYITDANGCTGSQDPAGVVSGPITHVDTGVIVTASATVTQSASCFTSNDGAAQVDLPNPIFDYSWWTDLPGFPVGPDNNLGTGNTYSAFSAGNYWLVASYAPASNFGQPIPGCDAYDLVPITSPSEITFTYSTTKPLCWDEETGSITLNVSGGSPIYTIEWDTTVSLPNGATGNVINNLFAGTYGFTITDDNGCTLVDSIELTQPDKLQVNFLPSIDASCKGDDDGVILINTVVGGTLPYDFEWDPNLTPIPTVPPAGPKWEGPAGSYYLEMTDDNGCSFDTTLVIGEPTDIQVTLEPVILGNVAGIGDIHVSCNGDSDGEIEAIVTGGNGDYTYAINTPPFSSNNIFTSLPAGSHTIFVEDSKGCEGDATIILNEPPLLEITLSTVTNDFGYNIDCYNGDNGYILAEAIGGTPQQDGVSYTYNWNTGATDDPAIISEIFGKTAGTYSCTVVDYNGCTASASTTLTSPNYTFQADVQLVNYPGPGSEQGNNTYLIEWEDNTLNSNGDPISDSLTHIWCWEYDTMSGNPRVCLDGEDEFTGENNFSHLYEGQGTYNSYVITIHNGSGCIADTIFFTIDVQGLLLDAPNVFSPNDDLVNDVFSFEEVAMDKMNVQIFNRWGEQVYSWEGEGGSWDGRGTDGQNLPEGVYYYILEATGVDGSKYSNKGSITLVR